MSSEFFLVTGGAGFIGSHLIAGLLGAYPAARVVSLDSYFTGSKQNHLPDPRVEYIEGETTAAGRIWADHGLPAPGVVFHLGEYPRVSQSFHELDLVWQSNLCGTKAVVDLCLQYGARLVYAGSSSKFGSRGDEENLSPYAWTKAKNVEYIRNVGDWYGLDHVITYFYNVYGPRQISQGPYATLIGIFEEQVRAGLPLTVAEPGTQTRDFTHVEDIVAGIVLCAAGGSGDGHLLGTGREHRIIDVARMFGGPVQMVPSRRGDRPRGLASMSKAQALGWRPKIRLEDYIANLAGPLSAESACPETWKGCDGNEG
ncbi:NAD-dependent epimerase/dehydratase family protein [Streptomyces sp. NPDC005283]|uniref:NAD-dependent epimerase/dehydratase family protein n=1 Tax=Streptomyces sp. NPDC005283 TaxID=3156871 RepID=UPI0034540683